MRDVGGGGDGEGGNLAITLLLAIWEYVDQKYTHLLSSQSAKVWLYSTSIHPLLYEHVFHFEKQNAISFLSSILPESSCIIPQYDLSHTRRVEETDSSHLVGICLFSWRITYIERLIFLRHTAIGAKQSVRSNRNRILLVSIVKFR